MKRIYLIGLVATLGACSGHGPSMLGTGHSASGGFPGVPTKINCNAEPEYVYSKTGQLIETIPPILHPSCADSSSGGGLTRSFFSAVVGNPNESDDNGSLDRPTLVSSSSSSPAAPAGGNGTGVTDPDNGPSAGPTEGDGSGAGGNPDESPSGGDGSSEGDTPNEGAGPGEDPHDDHTDACTGHDCSDHDPRSEAQPWDNHPTWPKGQNGDAVYQDWKDRNGLS